MSQVSRKSRFSCEISFNRDFRFQPKIDDDKLKNFKSVTFPLTKSIYTTKIHNENIEQV